MIRALAFTQGGNTPSARFRVRQYLPRLAEQGVCLTESFARFGSYPPATRALRLPWLAASVAERSLACLAGNRSDVVLFQREMVSTLLTAERLCRVPAVLDVDDAIWLTQRWGAVDRLAQRCRMVLCGNDYLAEHFASFAPVRVLPTGVDTDVWCPGSRSDTPVVVWSGSAGGLVYLYAIEPALEQVMALQPALRLRVCCNAAPRFTRLDARRVDYVPWSAQSEVAVVQSAWLGLMPIPDSAWARGKCSFKMLTYLAAGVPCVAAPWGMNQQVIDGGGALAAHTQTQWRDRMLDLLGDPEGARTMGLAGRAQVCQRYAAATLAGQLAQALKDAVR